MRRKTVMLLPALFVALVAVPTTATATAAKKTVAKSAFPKIPAGPIKFGVSVPLSGQTASFGLQAKASFEKVTLPNLKAMFPNGIEGHPIEFVILDDAGDVTKAVQVANQLVSDKVVAVVTASYNPTAVAQQLEVLNKAKVPYLGARPEAQYLDTTKYPYIYNISASTPKGAVALAGWIAKHPEVRKIGVISDGIPSSEEGVTALTTALAKTGIDAAIVKKVSVTPGATDMSTSIAEVKGANPDILYVAMAFNYGPLWQGMQAAGWAPKIYAPASAWYGGFDAMGSLADNAITTYAHCVAPDRTTLSPVVMKAMDGYVALFGTATTDYLTYSGTDDVPVILIKNAIEKYHSTSPAAIKKALEEMNNVTILETYNFTFSPTDHDGLTGALATNVCNMAPSKLAFGKYRIPTTAS